MSINYTSREKEKLREFINYLEAEDIDYIILRGFKNLPKEVLGGDIDILIRENDFDKVSSKLDELNFKKDRKNNYNKIINKVLQQPLYSIKYAFKKPLKTIRILSNSDKTNSKLHKSFKEEKRYRNNLLIHIFNHLSHRSTLNNSKVRLNPKVEKCFFRNCEKYSIENNLHINIPSPPERLFHLICRGIFDYNGEFKDYYIQECDKLYKNLDKAQKNRLNELLDLVFYKSAHIVTEGIENENYNSLKENLLRSSQY